MRRRGTVSQQADEIDLPMCLGLHVNALHVGPRGVLSDMELGGRREQRAPADNQGGQSRLSRGHVIELA